MKRTYCFRGTDGLVYERVCDSDKIPQTITVEGIKCVRDYQAECGSQQAVVKRTSNRVKRTYPMTCYASGVHADQAQQLRDHLKSKGVPTEVTTDGDPIYTSAAHRKKALKARGFRDKAAFC